MRVAKKDVGKRCTVEFDDIGRVDAMILDVESANHKNRQVYLFSDQVVSTVGIDQIVEIGDRVCPRKYA